MARLCKVEKDKRQRKLVAKFGKKRAELCEIIKNKDTNFEVKMNAIGQLQKLPRDSSRSRLRNRCVITGRSRGVYRKFGLGRNKLRELAMSGMIPGLRKASW